ncbi:MAG: beta-ketoacyl-ACP synthase III [Cyclonatronaceae bacterium]
MNNSYGRITGYGKALPRNIVTNADLEKKVDTSDQWITERTGIRQRHIVSIDEHCSTLAVEASRAAMEVAGIGASDLDLIIVATSSPDFLTPPVSSQIQHMLGASNIGAFTVVVGCTGFVSSLITADRFMRAGGYNHILVIGVEIISRMIDWEDRNTCVLFGDGAAAVVVSRTDEISGVLSHVMGSDGSGAQHIIHPSGGSALPPSHETIDNRDIYIKMNGREVFRFAVPVIGSTLQKIVDDAGLSFDDIDLLIPHQANARIIESAAKLTAFPEDRIFVNVHNYGNTSAASVPIALTEAFEQGRVKKGDIVAMIAFGAGLTWAGAVMKM